MPATPKKSAKPATPKKSAKPATPKKSAKPATPKREANQILNDIRGVRVSSEADAKRVQALVGEYKRARGRSTGLDDSAESVIRLKRNQIADLRGKTFLRQPKKRELATRVREWTTESYRPVQNALRAGKPAKQPETRRLMASMDMYMQRFALRAPQMPPKIRNKGNQRSEFPTLWRGASLQRKVFYGMMRSGHFAEIGYAAFSRDKEYATSFGTRAMAGVPVLFELNVRDVQRGTPWIWFTGNQEAGGAHNKAFVKPSWTDEDEVLLPPGIFQVKSVKTVDRREFYLDEGLPLPDTKLRIVKIRYVTVPEKRTLVETLKGRLRALPLFGV